MNRDVRSRPAGATWLTCQLHASDPRHPRPLALSFYAGPDRLIACEFGTIPERKLPEYALPIGGRLRFFLRRPRGTVIGFEVDGLHRIDVDAEQPSLWTAPRFRVPVLGLKSAVVAEILLRARVVLAGGSTPDVLAFERADECCAAGDHAGAEAALRKRSDGAGDADRGADSRNDRSADTRSWVMISCTECGAMRPARCSWKRGPHGTLRP